MVVVVVFGISHIVMCSGAARHRKGPPLRPGRPIQARVRVRVRDLCDGGLQSCALPFLCLEHTERQTDCAVVITVIC